MESFNYTVTMSKNINTDERKALLNLYQPVIGTKAAAIYLTLLEEKEVINKLSNLVFNEKRLMKLLKLTNAKLMEGIHKLEGIRLLKRTYQKAKDLVKFQILAPLDPNDFFANVVLNDMLKTALGEQDYEVIRYCYFDEEVIEDDVEDLTVSFMEAFPEESNDITLKSLSFDQKTFPVQPKVNLNLIDFSNLELELIKNDLPSSILTDSIRNLLIENVSFFDLNQDIILDALLQTYDYESKSINKSLLKVYLKSEIAKKNERDKLSQVEQLKNEFKQMSPEDYLESWMGVKANLSARRLITLLQTKYHLPNENINCLLNYSVLKNEGKIVDKYILKIADTLAKKNIVVLEDVMEHLKTAHQYTLNKLTELDAEDEAARFANIPSELGVMSNHDEFELPEPNKYFNL